MPRASVPLYPLGGYKQFAPRKSCLHRQAAIALYRALISQCRASPFSTTERTDLQTIVRNRFLANRNKVSSRLLKLHFHAGYKALDHLDGAVAGDQESVNHILSYLADIPEKLKCPPPPPTPPRVCPPDHAEPPPEHKFLANFPRPTVEGIRKVPFWTHATGLAFVRYKKPQPYNLSRTIRQLLLQKNKRVDYQHLLWDYYIPLAEHEDAWENILRENLGVKSGEATFGREMRGCLAEVVKAFAERERQAVELAGVMVDIVEKEKELAIEEREERRRIAWEKRQAKKNGLIEEKDALSELEGNR